MITAVPDIKRESRQTLRIQNLGLSIVSPSVADIIRSLTLDTKYALIRIKA
jgi:hypothetical protein